MTARRRLGWLGPAIVIVGLAAGAVMIWFMVRSRPTAGEVIDTFQIDPQATIIVRHEAGGGERSFVEVRVGDEVQWQAMVPHYAGKKGVPALAWSEASLAIRVVRDKRAEIFAVALRDGTKLGAMHLGTEHGEIDPDAPGPITLTDHLRSYEIVSGDGWHQLVGVDLRLGIALWKKELGPLPVTDGGVEGGLVWVVQGGNRRYFRVFSGAEDATVTPPPKPL